MGSVDGQCQWAVSLGGEDIKMCQPPHLHQWSQQGPHFSHTVLLKLMMNAYSSGKIVSSGISGETIASVHSEKTCLKKLMMIIMMMIIIIYNRKTIY